MKIIIGKKSPDGKVYGGSRSVENERGLKNNQRIR